ncbi:flagellar biosynthetic protein FliO [Photobacterium angustum]|uniref:Flagellar protein n=1 Tax=Photobacterium angustum TaxID=661 RepID=A0A855SGR1_PHOAN|nr:flagellar biosynthetic protein FliO [Photobacterium angustum]PSW90656.1 flagellar biosynthetic protein FliO [Photobacterium angustum]PSX09374.1 flagellar biosynthetic protein FliO [Photobacterium angustum]PSX12498.1 flagellar biosynthetic protein FliO [Photobacterium angustum]PSX16134.1 flagellar biosynthetic protein FliO [Photobacterium angustum]PSX25253.1 flagellar biosynthetic protein FliO [Photobacterium angustum]
MKRIVGQIVTALSLLFFTLSCFAQTAVVEKTIEKAPPPLRQAPDLNIATTLASLLLVIAIIVFLAWLLKRMRVAGISGNDSGLKVITQLAVGQRERVVLLQVGEEQMLVGITQHNISLLSKLDKPLNMDESPSRDFASQLSKLMKNNVKK